MESELPELASAASISFDGHIKAWALAHLRRHHWRFAGMVDKEELQNEAFWIFWRVKTRHPEVTNKTEFMRLFKAGIRFRVKQQSKACFPNPYNASTDPSGRCISLTEPEDGGDVLERTIPSYGGLENNVAECLDLLGRMPDELKEVCAALLREALGLQTLPALIRRKLKGKPVMEALNHTLSRLYGLDKGRDLFEEIGQLAPHGVNDVSLQAEVLSATKIKRKPGESEQAFLKRLVEKLDKYSDEEFFELPEEVRNWHDRAVAAVGKGKQIPPLAAGITTKASKHPAVEDEDEEEDEMEDMDDTDEDLTEEDEELEEEEEEEEEAPKVPKGKAKGGKAAATKAAKATKAAQGENGEARRGRPRRAINDDMKIRILAESNPRRAGSAVHEQFKLYKDGASVGEFYKKGGQRKHLVRDIRRGFVTVEPA